MYKENLILLETTASENASIAPAQKKQLFFNILLIDNPESTVKVSFTTSATEEAHRFALSTLPKASQQKFMVDGIRAEYVYTTFEAIDGGIAIDVTLKQHEPIMRAYLTKRLRDYLTDKLDIVRGNFLHDLQVWREDKGQQGNSFRVYKKYGLRIQVDSHTKTPELLISWDGISRVSNYTLKRLYGMKGFDNKLITKFIFRNRYYSEKDKPEAARLHPEEVYPILNAGLMRFLGLETDHSPIKNRHRKYYDEVKWFYKTFINFESFRQIIPHKGVFKRVDDSRHFRIDHSKNLLEFGENNMDYDPKDGLKKYGPAVSPETDQMQYFFIVSSKDTIAMNRLNEYLKSDSGYYGALNQYIKIAYRENEDLRIVFDPDDNPLDFIIKKIYQLKLEPNTGYCAFFISPWTEWEQNLQKWVIHPRLKEVLLGRGIMMQTLDRNKVMKGNLQYFMPNLAIAMTGKLGGVPWRLSKNSHDKELIVGFGAFRSNRHNVRYVGASFCFSNDGTFQKLDCFRADQLYAIAGSLHEALSHYRNQNQDVKRIVVHFYKKLSKNEMYPIEKMLRDINLDVPVVVVTVNKTFSKDIVAFAGKDDSTLPLTGSYIRYGDQKYLFYINDRFSWGNQPLKNMPMPLKISLSCNSEGYLADPGIVKTLMQQVYDFCFMYWRSMKHAALPVTVVYPEMLARILPWFEYKVLPEKMEHRLFML